MRDNIVGAIIDRPYFHSYGRGFQAVNDRPYEMDGKTILYKSCVSPVDCCSLGKGPGDTIISARLCGAEMQTNPFWRANKKQLPKG